MGHTRGVRIEARNPRELGAEFSRELGRLVPHDGYMLLGLDPLTGIGCLTVTEQCYSRASYRQLEIGEYLGNDLHSMSSLVIGPSPVGMLGTGSPEERHSVRLHEIMAAEGFGSEMRMVFTLAGVTWGGMTLVRERGRRAFSTEDAGHAERLCGELAQALRRFHAGRRLRPVRLGLAPGVIVVDANDNVSAVTPTGRDWLRMLLPPGAAANDDELFSGIWNVVVNARRAEQPALSRIPTREGWLVLQAQPLDGKESGEVVVTVQPASATLLLPAVAAWCGITPRERQVLDQALEGMPAKQIARRLDLSQHTVNDHLKAVYRKTGVSGREELIAGLSS